MQQMALSFEPGLAQRYADIMNSLIPTWYAPE